MTDKFENDFLSLYKKLDTCISNIQLLSENAFKALLPSGSTKEDYKKSYYLFSAELARHTDTISLVAEKISLEIQRADAKCDIETVIKLNALMDAYFDLRRCLEELLTKCELNVTEKNIPFSHKMLLDQLQIFLRKTFMIKSTLKNAVNVL